MKPLYIVGTQRDVGKTTLSIGLVSALRARGLKVAYSKPLGQRTKTVAGKTMHDDQRVLASLLGPGDCMLTDMAVPILSGRVEKEIFNFNPAELMAKIAGAFDVLRKGHDVILIEAMGHVAMGSVLGTSAADVSKALGARAILVSGGGIGRAVDDIALCSTFIAARGADLMGVVVNKVWPEKFDRVKAATSQAMKNLGLVPLGTVPFAEALASPTMRQLHDEIGGEILSPRANLEVRMRHPIVAAMLAEHMVKHIRQATLIITPGDREDNIRAALDAYARDGKEASVAGLLLTGAMEPPAPLREEIAQSTLPVILVEEDTFAAASKVHQTIFKITPDDRERIELAAQIVAANVDVDAILAGLE